MNHSPIRIALFASGTGTNALKLLEEAQSLGRVSIPLLITDRTDSPLNQEIPKRFPKTQILCITPDAALRGDERKTQHEAAILAALRSAQIDWIFLAGYMRIVGPGLIDAFTDEKHQTRIVNLHPSLLPDHPGVNGIEESFQSKSSRAGVTLHRVDEGVDTGPIVLQAHFSRENGESFESFHARIKQLEWTAYPSLLRELDEFGTILQTHAFFLSTTHEREGIVLWLRTSGPKLSPADFSAIEKLLKDPVDQTLAIDPSSSDWKKLDFKTLQVVRFRSGVTDNAGAAVSELFRALPVFKDRAFLLHSGRYTLLGKQNHEPLAFNGLIEESLSFEYPGPQASELNRPLFSRPKTDRSETAQTLPFQKTSLEGLREMSKHGHWAFSDAELLAIQAHYQSMGREPMDIEIETLAQTWSEHCKHKIFRAKINYEDATEKFTVDGLFGTYIAGPTEKLRDKKDWLVSVFHDNAGIVRFHETLDLCIKVETHNSPSALDPYGGALTGILGVNRDILGTGLGAKPVANTNVLCFGMPNETRELPVGVLHPKTILQGVHRGIESGGNKSGIPTVNGAMLFHEDFSGKPLVFCGTLGVLPREIQGQPASEKRHVAGDWIVTAGGSVGLDGIHGATLSSLALDPSTPATMVQIGDPLTQKRVTDFILEARDQGLFSSITDCGAGGISSAIGEMSERTGGAIVDLDRVPLKYPGLKPWQIWVSESQERMTLAVPPARFSELETLARKHGVLIAHIGQFTDSGKLDLRWNGKTLGDLSLAFLHKGVPRMELQARWNGPEKRASFRPTQTKPLPKSHAETLSMILSDPTVASKEKLVRQFDHEVKAATVVKPFEGVESSPNDGGLLWMGAYGNPGFEGVGIASGICPDLSDQDAGLMTTLAIDEAVRGLVAMGVDPHYIALVDNFCWPDPLPSGSNPAAEHRTAQLVRSCRAIAETALDYEMPFVSGKDSMKNNYVGKRSDGSPIEIAVPPTVLITAIGKHPDVRRAIRPAIQPGQHVYRLGVRGEETRYFGWMLPSRFNQPSLPISVDRTAIITFYRKFYEATTRGWITSAHDISEGGLLTALTESLFLHQCGLKLDLTDRLKSADETALFYGENPGQFIVSVTAENRAAFESHFSAADRLYLGESDLTACLEIKTIKTMEKISIRSMFDLWRNSL